MNHIERIAGPDRIALAAQQVDPRAAILRRTGAACKARSAIDPDLSRMSSILDRQVSQMARLLDDLLDVSRITRDMLELRKRRVSLEAVLDSALETSRPLIEEQGHQFELKVPSGPVYLEADPARLAQVFSNLLNNAAKYTDRGGNISLTVERDSKDVWVSVKDNGIGIEAQMLPKLFHRFTQALPALERAKGGLGLGLPLVRGLVEMHGGEVSAHSEGPGRGSEFTVRLGVAPARAAPVASERPAQPSAAHLKILVADDNPDVAQTLSQLLQMEGHQVHTAADGQEAVDMAAAFRPRVALIDIGMPKLNGYDAAMRIRAMLPGILLLAMTGWGQQEDIRKAMAAGFDHHLVKPIDVDEIERLLASVSTDQARGD